ncbi:MmgE/PrpD family protein [Streptomyces sp. NWU339]|uniref:MmgE/PrpD family protein n=1 Tax=Streptomyces sp. NWU339 TaxID=2185284 RepID=UPI001C635F0B|nr:MmgE/PrpD family protein [Streptomyces sp. NWU339]
MAATLTQHLADFTAATSYENLPDEVADDSKRVLLDSIGCALAAVDEPRGRIGIEYAGLQGGTDESATVLGSDKRSPVFGAGFANGELINALDFDAALPPGHVAPYVIPGALTVAEERGAIGRLRGLSAPTLAHGLGIAATFSPCQHPPRVDRARSQLHRHISPPGRAPGADRTDRELDGGAGPPRRPSGAGRRRGRLPALHRHRPLGPRESDRRPRHPLGLPSQHNYKPYPHCRILHAPLDALIGIVETHDIRPQEIESIRVRGEGWVMEPVWLSREVEHVHDAQFSIAHGIAVGAHRISPGRGWQDPVFGSSVRTLMDKVTYEPHPDYVTALEADPAARPTRVEVTARGTTHTAERSFPKGSPSPYATTDDLIDKSRHNASGVLSEADTDHAVETLLNLETAADVRAVLRALPPFPFAPVAPDDLGSHGPDGDKNAADRGRTHRPRRILGPGRAGARGRPVARPGSRPGRAARPA